VVHVALALYDKNGEYCRHTGTVIVSILENTRSEVFFHILHDTTLTDRNKKSFADLVNKYKQKIEFYPIFIEKDFDINKYKFIRYYSKAALYRLYLVELLKTVDKVIYLDSDIIFNLDINLLWNENINEKAIGAVSLKNALGKFTEEIIQREFQHVFYQKVNIMNECYFNSGVLVFNLEKIRRDYNLKTDCIEFLNKYSDSPFPDNDALNYLFQNDCKFLDGKYNKLVYFVFNLFPEEYDTPDKWENNCWHFSANKPWDMKMYDIDFLYWKYFYLTPWGGIEGLMKYVVKRSCNLDEIILYYPIKSKKRLLINFAKRFFIKCKNYFITTILK
jgi:lipopolysaccharide biosynthesis glycosyltransferase